MATPAAVRFKAGDLWDVPDDGKRYEVIDGRLYVTPPPAEKHQSASGVLFGYLWSWTWPRRAGRLYAAPIAVVLDDETGVQPGLVYVSRERVAIIAERGIDGAPDLIIEILSPGTRVRDLGVKMRRYAAAGVPHYWVADPATHHLTPYKLAATGYEAGTSNGPGDVFEPELFPGLRIPIDELWE